MADRSTAPGNIELSVVTVDSLPVVRVAPGVLLNWVEKLLPAAVDLLALEPRVLPPNDEPPELPLDLFDLTT